jgi:hypothetical protein
MPPPACLGEAEPAEPAERVTERKRRRDLPRRPRRRGNRQPFRLLQQMPGIENRHLRLIVLPYLSVRLFRYRKSLFVLEVEFPSKLDEQTDGAVPAPRFHRPRLQYRRNPQVIVPVAIDGGGDHGAFETGIDHFRWAVLAAIFSLVAKSSMEEISRRRPAKGSTNFPFGPAALLLAMWQTRD